MHSNNLSIIHHNLHITEASLLSKSRRSPRIHRRLFPSLPPSLYRAGNLHCTKTMKGSNDHYQKRYAFSGRKSIRSRVYGRIPVARPVVTGVDDSHPLDHAGGAKATMITHTQPRLVTPGDRNYTTGIPWTRTPWWPIQPPESRDNSATTNCRAVQTNAYYPRFGEQF